MKKKMNKRIGFGWPNVILSESKRKHANLLFITGQFIKGLGLSKWLLWRCCTWTATSSGSIELKRSNQPSSGKNSLFQSRYDQEQGKCINFHNLLSRRALAYFQNGHSARLERKLWTRACECLRTTCSKRITRETEVTLQLLVHDLDEHWWVINEF